VGEETSKPVAPPSQTRNKALSKELRTSKSCRNNRVMAKLSLSGGLLAVSTDGNSACPDGMQQQQRKSEKERRKEEKQREKVARKEREREKELLRKGRRTHSSAEYSSSSSPAASPRSFMSRLSGVPG
jgi:hypothetical protein